MVNIPKRTLVTMMNALSSGVVPRRGLEHIAVGRRKESETFISDLETTAEGGGAFRIISGRYGNGKSFLMQMVRNKAMDEGFVVMDADLSVNRRLTGGKNEGLATYRELVKNMAVRSRPDGGAMETVVQEYIAKMIERISKELGKEIRELDESCSVLGSVPASLSQEISSDAWSHTSGTPCPEGTVPHPSDGSRASTTPRGTLSPTSEYPP